MSPSSQCRRYVALLFLPCLCSCADDEKINTTPVDAATALLLEGRVTSPDLPARPDLGVDLLVKSGTGGRGGQTGHTTQTIDHGGNTRLFAVHVPPSYQENLPMGLLLHFHGWRPLPAEVSEELDYIWGPTADQFGFIAVAPEGLPCPELNPKDPYGCFKESRDDSFVSALIAHLGQLYNLDLTQVRLSGHSGGAFFVQGHGIAHGNIYASAATFSGGCISNSDEYGNSCSVYRALSQKASRKIPVFVVHHASDQVVPVEYSANLLAVLKAGVHPTQALDQYNPPGENGHSIDIKIVPQVWEWISDFTLPSP